MNGRSRLLPASLAAVFALGAALGWRQIASPDIGFHLSSARWILEHHAWPTTDPFSFTFADHPYVDLQWIFQLGLYGLNRLGGPPLIVAAKIVVTFGFWALLLVRARRRGDRLPWSAPLFLVLLALGDSWEERPHLLSWILGSLVLLILEEQGRGARRWLPLLPVLLLVWVNTHSLFVLGLVSIGAYTLFDVARDGVPNRRLAAVTLAAVALCLINPYGLRGLLLPLTQYQEIQGGQAFQAAGSGIAEFQSPFDVSQYFVTGRFVLFQSPLFWHLYSLLTVIGLVGAWPRSRWPERVLWALFAVAFWQANKNFGYFAMATFPAAAAGLDALLSGHRQPAPEPGGMRAPARKRRTEPLPPAAPVAWPAWTAIGVSAIVIALVPGGRWYHLTWNPQRVGSAFNPAFLPVAASQFLADHGITGRVLTTFGDGGYVSWATRQPVSMYGITEVAGPESYTDYVNGLTPAGFPAYLSRVRPTVAVVSFREAPYWAFYLSGLPDWRLAQFSDTAAVYLYSDVAGPPELPPPAPGVDYRVRPRDEVRAILTQASTRPLMTPLSWLQGSAAFEQDRIRLATFYLHSGWLEASAQTGVDALADSPVRVVELFLLLGNAFNAQRDYELADLCYATVLASSPDSLMRGQIDAAKRARQPR